MFKPKEPMAETTWQMGKCELLVHQQNHLSWVSVPGVCLTLSFSISLSTQGGILVNIREDVCSKCIYSVLYINIQIQSSAFIYGTVS